MHIHDYLLTVLAFFSEILGTLTGFGSSTFFVPIAQLFEPFRLVLALTAILHCLGNFVRIILFRNFFHWKFFIQLAFPFVILTLIGALLIPYFSAHWMRRSLGLTLIFLSISFFIIKRFRFKLPSWLATVLSGLSGFSTGLVGTGGAIRGLALTTLDIEKNSFISLSASIDMGGDLLRAFVYLKNGFMDFSQWYYIPLLGIAAYLGSKVGKFLLNNINQNQFDKLISILILFSGIAMLF